MLQYYNLDWLNKQLASGKVVKYIYFWGHTSESQQITNACFSQWFVAPFIVDGITYQTAEHWMMAQKAFLFGDIRNFNKIVSSEKPGAAKELGRTVQNFDEQIWDEWRYEIVKTGNIHKFNQHPALADFLIGTGDRVLVEASPVDKIWGVGLTKDNSQINDPNMWRGLNLLGFALMEARHHLRSLLVATQDSWKTLSKEKLQVTAAWQKLA